MQSVLQEHLAAVAALLLPLTASACAGIGARCEAPALSVGAVPGIGPGGQSPNDQADPLSGRDAQPMSAGPG